MLHILVALLASVTYSRHTEALPQESHDAHTSVVETMPPHGTAPAIVESTLANKQDDWVTAARRGTGPPIHVFPRKRQVEEDTPGLDANSSQPNNVFQLPLTIGASFQGSVNHVPTDIPPDPTIAVGPNHVVETTNTWIDFFDKAGNVQFQQSLRTFFNITVGHPAFDPLTTYDQYSGRFIVILLEHQAFMGGPDVSQLHIAISDDSDPNGTWYKYNTNANIMIGGLLSWIDYPGLGVDANAIYVTTNLIGDGTGTLNGVVYRIFDKTPLLTGGAAVYTDLTDAASVSVKPAHSFDTPIAPYFVSADTATTIRLQAIQNPLGGSPTLITATVVVPFYRFPTSGIPQPGTSVLLDALDGNIINAVWMQRGLYAAHGIKANGKVIARWYQFDCQTWPTSGAPVLVQSGNIDAGNDAMGSPIYTWCPAISANECKDVGVVVARSSTNEYPSIWVTGRTATDPIGTMNPLSALYIGSNSITGLPRWGDYYGIAVDPSNSGTFWCVGEFVPSSTPWSTWVGSFWLGSMPPNCP